MCQFLEQGLIQLLPLRREKYLVGGAMGLLYTGHRFLYKFRLEQHTRFMTKGWAVDPLLRLTKIEEIVKGSIDRTCLYRPINQAGTQERLVEGREESRY